MVRVLRSTTYATLIRLRKFDLVQSSQGRTVLYLVVLKMSLDYVCIQCLFRMIQVVSRPSKLLSMDFGGVQ